MIAVNNSFMKDEVKHHLQSKYIFSSQNQSYHILSERESIYCNIPFWWRNYTSTNSWMSKQVEWIPCWLYPICSDCVLIVGTCLESVHGSSFLFLLKLIVSELIQKKKKLIVSACTNHTDIVPYWRRRKNGIYMLRSDSHSDMTVKDLLSYLNFCSVLDAQNLRMKTMAKKKTKEFN